MLEGDLADRVAHVASVQTEILFGLPTRDLSSLDDDLSQGPVQQLGVVEVGAADSDRQRDDMGLRPAPALRWYCRPGCRLRAGTSGSTLLHK